MWVGWFRKSDRDVWRRVCATSTMAECAERLTRATDHLRLPSRCYVMTTGGPPRDPSSSRQTTTAPGP